jgi:hypothetical protein
MGPGSDSREEEEDVEVEEEIREGEEPLSADGRRGVRKMSLNDFRSKLVTHFDIGFKKAVTDCLAY